MRKEGFTLVEIIIFIAVAAIILPAIIVPFATSIKESLTPEKVATASYLAQQRMEVFTKNSYAAPELAPTPLTSYTPADVSGYQWQWKISHVDENLADAPGDVGYKRIWVRVKDPDNREIEVQTVVTRRPAD